MAGFFHVYNILLQNGHLTEPIRLIERLLDTFKEDVFYGGQRPKKDFVDALWYALEVKAQYLGDPNKMRRRKGGDQAMMQFRSKGAPNEHKKFTKQCKLHALAQANWLVARLDRTQFPFLNGRSRGATEVLDALKADLTQEITGRTPLAMLNYNLILVTVANTLNRLERVTRTSP